jgi:ribosomal protein S18 acetylase RimI-like enzyme
VAEVLETQGLNGQTRRVVGTVVVAHDERSHEDGKFRVNVMVHPDFQARGIGTSLWQTAWNHLETLSPRKLTNMTSSDSVRGLRMVEHLGFRQVWERIESFLDPSTVDFARYADLDARLEGAGVSIHTLAAVDDPNKYSKLFDLDVELMRDVPFGQAMTTPSFEQFEKEFRSDPSVIEAAIWIAVKDGEWIAFSSLETQPDCFAIGMTGVKAAYRGQGVAKRLKLEGVRYALQHGGLEIRTANDAVNTAMLQMNASMGFQRKRSRLRFEKVL